MHALPVVLALTGFADPVTITPERIRQSVETSIVYLQEEALDWVRDRKCASCHHAPMMIWALNEAKAAGYPVDEEALAEVSRFTLDDPIKSKLLPEPKKPGEAESKPVSSLPTAYAALAFRSIPADAPGEESRRAQAMSRDYLLRMQGEDGGWHHDGGRPPMLESREVATLMTLLGLGDAISTEGREKALGWLRANQPGSLQGRALRLLVQPDAESNQPEVRAILDEQNDDGGWGQTPELPSDAFATGQILYVLSLTGVPLDRSEIVRARAFLVRTQTDEGSWEMASRPIKPGDEPAKDLRPITYAGTAWATLGLLRSSPR